VKKVFLLILCVLLAAMFIFVAVFPTSASSPITTTETNGVDTSNSDERASKDASMEKKQGGHQIDGVTRLVSYSYSDGKFELVIKSEINQDIVLKDLAAALQKDGISSSKDAEVSIEGGENVVEFDVEEVRGNAVIIVSTIQGSVTLSESRQIFEEEVGWGEVRMSALAGATSGFLLPFSFSVYKKYRELGTPDKIL